MQKRNDDALQKRLAKFLGATLAPASTNSLGDFCVATNIGAVRKQNQDRALLVFATYSETPERNFTLAVVCDGVGGMSQGDDAAIIAVSTFVSRVLRLSRTPVNERLHSAAMAANDAVYGSFRGKGGRQCRPFSLGNRIKPWA